MPSPVTHIAAAAAVFATVRRFDTGKETPAWRVGAVCLFFSMAPDLDSVLGILAGDMGAYHNQMTHSLFFGLAVCLAAAPLLLPFLRGYRTLPIFIMIYGAYALHLALDWMTYGRGLKLFWPFTDQRFLASPTIFYGVRWSEGIFNHQHWYTLLNELMILSALGVVFMAFRYLLRQRSGKGTAKGLWAQRP